MSIAPFRTSRKGNADDDDIRVSVAFGLSKSVCIRTEYAPLRAFFICPAERMNDVFAEFEHNFHPNEVNEMAPWIREIPWPIDKSWWERALAWMDDINAREDYRNDLLALRAYRSKLLGREG